MNEIKLPRCKTLDEIYDSCFDSMLSDEMPKRFRVGRGFEQIRLEPKQIIALCAPPGSGKTALIMQWMYDAMRLDENVKVVVCNVEMPPEMLLIREVARQIQVDSRWILDKKHKEEPQLKKAIADARVALAEFRPRLIFVEPPYTLDNIGMTWNKYDADVVVIDYLQRLQPNDNDKNTTKDKRQRVMNDMSELRKWANAGLAIIAVSSVNRNPKNGVAYQNIGMGSFSESSEIEYGADVGYALEPHKGNETKEAVKDSNGNVVEQEMILQTVKPPRYASPHSVIMKWELKTHHFTVLNRRVNG